MSKVNELREMLFEAEGKIGTVTHSEDEIRVARLTENSLKDFYTHGAGVVDSVFRSASFNQLNEAPATSQANVTNFTKMLIPVIARTAASSMSLNTLVPVVPMSSHVAQVTYMRRIRGISSGTVEAAFKVLDTTVGGKGTHGNTHDPFMDAGDVDTTPADGVDDAFSLGTPYTVTEGEALGEIGGTPYGVSSVRFDKVTMTSGERKLKCIVPVEAIEDAVNEMNINLIQEHMFTARRELEMAIFEEIFGKLLIEAKKLPDFNLNAIATDDAQVLADKNLVIYHRIQQAIADIEIDTLEPGLRFSCITTPRVLRRMNMISKLHIQIPARISTALDTNTYYHGTLGDVDLYQDPRAGSKDYILIVAKGQHIGASAAIFGSYVPLSVMHAVDPFSFQQVIGFRSRYACITTPFAVDPVASTTVKNSNKFARAFRVLNA